MKFYLIQRSSKARLKSHCMRRNHIERLEKLYYNVPWIWHQNIPRLYDLISFSQNGVSGLDGF